MISRVATSLPLLFDVRWVTPTSEPLPFLLVDPKCVSQLECSRQCRGGGRQRAFIQTQRNFTSVLSLRVNIGYPQPLGALVLICFVTKCRHDLLIGAR